MGQTATYQLPFPEPTDPADVPTDLKELAERIEAVVGPGTASGQVPVWDNTAKKWVAGSAPGSAKIGEVVVAAPQQLIDFQNIPQTYSALEVVLYLRADTAATSVTSGLRFNGDAGNNYDWERLAAAAASVTATENLGASAIDCGNMPGASAPANVFSAHSIRIPNYAGALQKISEIEGALKFGTTTGTVVRYSATGAWRSNAAINRITFNVGGNANFVAGAKAVLYGLV
ncbi:MAG TPA: hypothetical protein VKB54_07060 [Solirubrobacteraceae bacterium]|nr:hypothetical protein [Solirubrobacteraceae bacterium]